MEKFQLKFEELEVVEEMISDDALGDIFRVIGVVCTAASLIAGGIALT